MPAARTAPLTAPLTLAAATAEDLMCPNPVSLPQDASVAEAIALLADRGLSAAPVIDEAGHPRGVLSRDDIFIHERERLASAPAATPDPSRVADLMTHHVQTCTPEDSVKHVMGMMTRHHIRHVPVKPCTHTSGGPAPPR